MRPAASIPACPGPSAESGRAHLRPAHLRLWLTVLLAAGLLGQGGLWLLGSNHPRAAGRAVRQTLALAGMAIVLEQHPVAFTQQVEAHARLGTGSQAAGLSLGGKKVLAQAGPGWFWRLSLRSLARPGSAWLVLTVVGLDPSEAGRRLVSRVRQGLAIESTSAETSR